MRRSFSVGSPAATAFVNRQIEINPRWPAGKTALRHPVQEGFTLVEMLIASLVFTVAIVSLMSMVLFAVCSVCDANAWGMSLSFWFREV